MPLKNLIIDVSVVDAVGAYDSIRAFHIHLNYETCDDNLLPLSRMNEMMRESRSNLRPPIILSPCGDKFKVVDGRHRLARALILGHQEISYDYRHNSPRVVSAVFWGKQAEISTLILEVEDLAMRDELWTLHEWVECLFEDNLVDEAAEQQALLHNRAMHALNGNIDAQPDQRRRGQNRPGRNEREQPNRRERRQAAAPAMQRGRAQHDLDNAYAQARARGFHNVGALERFNRWVAANQERIHPNQVVPCNECGNAEFQLCRCLVREEQEEVPEVTLEGEGDVIIPPTYLERARRFLARLLPRGQQAVDLNRHAQDLNGINMDFVDANVVDVALYNHILANQNTHYKVKGVEDVELKRAHFFKIAKRYCDIKKIDLTRSSNMNRMAITVGKAVVDTQVSSLLGIVPGFSRAWKCLVAVLIFGLLLLLSAAIVVPSIGHSLISAISLIFHAASSLLLLGATLVI